MSVYMRLNGGLGNQMFEYAFLYSLFREEKNQQIYCIMHHNPREDPREFALNCFDLSLCVDVVDESESSFRFKSLMVRRKILYHLYRTIYKKEAIVFAKLQRHGICYATDTYLYVPTVGTRKKYIEGCFQAYQYFDSFSDEIRKEFTVKIAPDKRNAEKISEIKSCESVCVHIRRGDYLNNRYSEILAVCDYEYYRKAIEEVRRHVKNPVFYIFSNTHEDIQWIKANYDLGEVEFVDLGNQDYEELRLMYSCKHFIISNSTYSWWAQYLSDNTNKIVVAPSIWNRDKSVSSENIYLPNWHLIEV